jgi:hypothetical protein
LLEVINRALKEGRRSRAGPRQERGKRSPSDPVWGKASKKSKIHVKKNFFKFFACPLFFFFSKQAIEAFVFLYILLTYTEAIYDFD